MKISSFLLSSAIFLFLPLFGVAQTNEVKFHLITGSNGIGLGKINSITQDKNGRMWFSDQTNGCITRYDGSLMTRYLHDYKNPNSLGGYYPECLLADASGMLWIGFYGQGLDQFNPETNTFKHYTHHAEDGKSLANDTITSLLIDHLGHFWIGTYAGLDLFDPKAGTFTHYQHKDNDPTSLSYNRIRAIYEDHEGTIWVGTGLAWDLDEKGGLNRFDREKGNFIRYLHDPNDPHSLVDNKVRAVFEDSRGNFWVGTRGDGLHRMNRKTGTFERISSVHPDVHQPYRPPVSDIYDHITFITEDHNGALWIGTVSNGLARYDPKTQMTTFFRGDSKNMHGFTDNSGWCAFTSSGGLFWISTQEANIFQVELYQNFFPAVSIDGLSVSEIKEDAPGVFWLATSNGIQQRDVAGKVLQSYVNIPSDSNSISSNYTNKIAKDQDGFLWISTANGLNRFDPKTKKFKCYFHNPNNSNSVSFNAIGDMYADRDSNLWLGTFSGGLDRLNIKTEKFTTYQHKESDTTSLSSDLIISILPDESGDLWIGTVNEGGLDRLNVTTSKFKHYLPGQDIIELFADASGIIWAGTVDGLSRYDKKTDQFSTFTLIPGINSFGYITSITEDDDHNLWVAASTGLFRIDASRQKVMRYGNANGINGTNFNTGCALKGTNGTLYFGTLTGLYIFNPHDLKIPALPVNVELNSLWLNGIPVKPGPQSPIDQSIAKAKLIQFHYNENVFSIGFSMTNFGNAEDKAIYYKLENFEKDWNQTGPNGQAYYYSVPPGNYTFHVKATNLNGDQWAETSVLVHIAPPWWNTWYAYLLYGVLFISLAYFGYRFQKKLWLKAERERTKDKELAQAKEMEKAYNELKSTQTQLVHAEKMASLGELTAGIAHEIQNPLNFVNNFSEVNAELIDEMNAELAKGNMQEAKEIGGNIKDNEEKINFHGKRADAIVKGMLLHSRTSNGLKEPTDINALADEYLRLAYHGLRAKDKSFNATMKTDFDPNIGLINVVPQDIGRVILNLITNAFYAVSSAPLSPGSSPPLPPIGGKKDSPTVVVTTKGHLPPIGGKGGEGESVMISVSDNGPGIPQKVLDKIFQPFFTTKPVGQGTGLGLSISYDIVKAHGGQLRVETKEGEGTTFIISLPI
jgi:signal transduction histidine kinase/ligand-binding sensor domain-containing protein